MTGDSAIEERAAPPRPRLSFRVGVVGHRPDRLQHADPQRLVELLTDILREIEQAVRDRAEPDRELYAPGEPILRAISPLAEGVDRSFAEAALDLGWQLCCVMPFAQAEYERDFVEKPLEPDSLARFRGLLQRARRNGLTCFELDGSRAAEGLAYGAAGRVVLDQSDVLIVVWDGMRLSKTGGTEATLDEARQRGLPVFWIDAHAPHTWQWLAAGSDLPTAGDHLSPGGPASTEPIREQVCRLLEVPRQRHRQDGRAVPTPAREEPRRQLLRFYGERRPALTLSAAWKVFRDLVADTSWPSPRLFVPRFETDVLAEWPRDRSTPAAATIDRLRPFYAWPDKLAVLYSDRYRSAFVLGFLLAAGAVAMALAPVGLNVLQDDSGVAAFGWLELAAIAAIIALVLVSRRRAWHERWIDYRLVAELVRHLRIVSPMGGGRPFAQVPSHFAIYGQLSSSWMEWYVRAVARALGLPDMRLDRESLLDCLDKLEQVLQGQLGFHQKSHERHHVMEARLDRCCLVLLGLTLVCCVLHLSHVLLPGYTLIFACGFLPALGAALAGINNQGEFRRIAKRSRAMVEHLERLLSDLASLRTEIEKGSTRSFGPEVRTFARQAAGLLLSEVLDWRVLVLDRPPPVV